MRALTVGAVVVVGAVAAYVSYWHMRDLTTSVGEGTVQSYILPLSVDGMMLAATGRAVGRRRKRQAIGWWCWFALGLGLAASTAANIAAAQPTWEGRLVATWPPLALFVSLKLLFFDEPAPKPKPQPVTSKPKAEPKRKPTKGKRADQLEPLAREVAQRHNGKLTRKALQEGLAERDESCGTDVALQLLARLNGNGQ